MHEIQNIFGYDIINLKMVKLVSQFEDILTLEPKHTFPIFQSKSMNMFINWIPKQ